jgi:type IV secretory pathway TrbL component
VELLILGAAILIVFVIFSWLLKLVKTTVKTILLVGFVVLALYLVFGIGPATIWEQLKDWTQQN